MTDIFRPRFEPAASIYDAFQAEAAKRKGRRAEEWIEAERGAVLRAACEQAQRLGLREPGWAEVVSAEACACGHVDYGAKWALGVADAMRMRNAPEVSKPGAARNCAGPR